MPCSAVVLALGAGKGGDTLALVVRRAVAEQRWGFLLELIGRCGDVDLTEAVLAEALAQSSWGLVEGLLPHLSDVQKERACDAAAANQCWDLAFTLLRDAVSPCEDTVDEIFRNKVASRLISGCPESSL